jgi:hypothetical protein
MIAELEEVKKASVDSFQTSKDDLFAWAAQPRKAFWNGLTTKKVVLKTNIQKWGIIF